MPYSRESDPLVVEQAGGLSSCWPEEADLGSTAGTERPARPRSGRPRRPGGRRTIRRWRRRSSRTHSAGTAGPPGHGEEATELGMDEGERDHDAPAMIQQRMAAVRRFRRSQCANSHPDPMMEASEAQVRPRSPTPRSRPSAWRFVPGMFLRCCCHQVPPVDGTATTISSASTGTCRRRPEWQEISALFRGRVVLSRSTVPSPRAGVATLRPARRRR